MPWNPNTDPFPPRFTVCRGTFTPCNERARETVVGRINFGPNDPVKKSDLVVPAKSVAPLVESLTTGYDKLKTLCYAYLVSLAPTDPLLSTPELQAIANHIKFSRAK